MGTARSHLSALGVNDLIYVFGGKNSPHRMMRTVSVFDPVCNHWYCSKSMNTYRSDAAAILK